MQASPEPRIEGFLKSPKILKGRFYAGRFMCPDVQWAGTGTDTLCTFTITAEEITDAADSQLLWTDQDVQRGIQPGLEQIPPRELCLSEGYPDPKKYIFDTQKSDEIVEKLLAGDILFLSPLIWNLRPKTFQAYFDYKKRNLYLYSGKIYLPDSHHRHQAISKAVKLWRESPDDFPNFSGDREFKIELYFLNSEDEGNYFYAKNQLPKPTSKSKAFDLTTQDDLSLLAKRAIEYSENLKENVNRVTDRLSAKNPHVMTLSTLREMMKSFSSDEQLDSSELDGLARVAARFYDLLAEIRPELGRRNIAERSRIRARSLVDSAVMMHGYAALMKEFNSDLAFRGENRAISIWSRKVECFRSSRNYSFGRWAGDLFAKDNPLWAAIGVVKPSSRSREGKLTVLNTGSARAECGRVLKQLLALPKPPSDLRFLSKG